MQSPFEQRNLLKEHARSPVVEEGVVPPASLSPSLSPPLPPSAGHSCSSLPSEQSGVPSHFHQNGMH